MNIEEEMAQAIADVQNVPFVGAKQKRIAAALMPLVRRAQAEALREAAKAAEDWVANDGMNGGEWMPSEWGSQANGWLRHRADRIEQNSEGESK